MPFNLFTAEINYPEVDTYADLPDVSASISETYLVLTTTGVWGINRKEAGLWRSDGINWSRLGVLPVYPDTDTGEIIITG